MELQYVHRMSFLDNENITLTIVFVTLLILVNEIHGHQHCTKH